VSSIEAAAPSPTMHRDRGHSPGSAHTSSCT
jgi:hypothetical protein